MFGSNKTMVAPMAYAPMTPDEKGLFGRRKYLGKDDGVTMAHRNMPNVLQSNDVKQAPAMPGPISGFGGGTFGMNGEQVTPADAASPSMGEGVPQQGVPQQQGPLGGSMRQPFDYDRAMEVLKGQQPKGPNGWQMAAAVIGDALVQNSGGRPFAMQNLMQRRDMNSQRQFDAAKQVLGWQHGDYSAQRDADLRAANPYTIGRERLGYNPATGQTEVLYQGRQDGEIYADSLGFDRGSDEWNAALEDYILRSSGPSAHERDIQMDDYRTANDRSLEGYRQQNRLQMEGARQGNRRGMVDYRNANPAPSRARSSRRTATDGNGNKVEWNGKAWVSAK